MASATTTSTNLLQFTTHLLVNVDEQHKCSLCLVKLLLLRPGLGLTVRVGRLLERVGQGFWDAMLGTAVTAVGKSEVWSPRATQTYCTQGYIIVHGAGDCEVHRAGCIQQRA